MYVGAEILVADDVISTNESDDGVVTVELCFSLISNLGLLRREVEIQLRTVPITASMWVSTRNSIGVLLIARVYSC